MIKFISKILVSFHDSRYGMIPGLSTFSKACLVLALGLAETLDSKRLLVVRVAAQINIFENISITCVPEAGYPKEIKWDNTSEAITLCLLS